MVICHCRAVNDKTIRAAILAGARDPAEVGRRCGAGARCGGCVPALLGLLDELDARDCDGRSCDVHSSVA